MQVLAEREQAQKLKDLEEAKDVTAFEDGFQTEKASVLCMGAHLKLDREESPISATPKIKHVETKIQV